MLGHDPLPGPLLTLDGTDLLQARAVLTRASQLRAAELAHPEQVSTYTLLQQPDDDGG